MSSRPGTIDNAISWLNDNDIPEVEPSIITMINLSLKYGDFKMFFNLNQEESEQLTGFLCADVEQLTRFGESIGINKSIRSCHVTWHPPVDGDPPHGPINEHHCQCIQSIYRGIESNTSITCLRIGLECIGFQVDESAPRFNLHDAPISSNLEELKFQNNWQSITLTDDDSTLIIQTLQSNSQVKSLDISCLPTSETAFPRIISACPSPMNSLNVSCGTAQHCSTIAEYLIKLSHGKQFGSPQSIRP